VVPSRLEQLRERVEKKEVKGYHELSAAELEELEQYIALLVTNLLGSEGVKKVAVKVERHGVIADIAVRAPVETGCQGQPEEERPKCVQEFVKRYRREQGWEYRVRVKRMWELVEAIRYIVHDGQEVVFNILVGIDKEEMWVDAVLRTEEVVKKIVGMAEKVLRA